MKNFLEAGKTVDVVLAADMNSGDFLLKGALFGVLQVSGLSGETVTLLTEGVFELPKATGAAWTQGDKVYWDNTAKNFTKTATANFLCAAAFADAASGDATGQVKLQPPGVQQ